ncbi:helix-turn-helix domain-containing protein [Streptococcus pluranimalium]|uniref:helix-turn-helix domain-containing protein n=1 Tax=Streptococcus pluranimalium TaxID=82348 RepID=UPI0039FC2C5F
MIENFAPNLIRLRKEKKLSQKELAQELGISAQTISNIENQTAYPTFANFEKIAIFFNATPNELLGSSRDIEVEKSIYETDEYVEKANDILNSVRTFRTFSKDLQDYNNPDSYTYSIVNNLSSLLKKEPILDPTTNNQLYKHIPTGKIVRAEDKVGSEFDYQLAFQPSQIEYLISLSEQITDLYQKMQYIERTQDLLNNQPFNQ